MKNKLAIVIPYFKINFFEKTLESLAKQTDKRFYVYIGDDASPEDCTSLLQKFEGQFDYVYHRFKTNIGAVSLTQQWERCIAMMQGEEWFMILGDDDVLTENIVLKFHQNQYNFNQVGTNVVRFNYRQIDSDGNFTSKIYNTDNLIDPVFNLIEKLKNNLFTSLSQYVFRKIAFEKYGFVDIPLAWSSDDLAVFQIAESYPIYSINEVILIRISEINISGNSKLNKQKNEALMIFFPLLLEKHKFNREEMDFISGFYFNQVLICNKLIKTIIFFQKIILKVSFKKKVYFIIVYLYKQLF